MLPVYNAQSMQLAIPAGISDAQIAEEIKVSLGKLVTDEDVAALLAKLPTDRNGPILVDIYQLYQEILARYQTRLHSDDRVWKAEIAVSQAQDALAIHVAEYGESVRCSGKVKTAEPEVCDRRDELKDVLESAMGSYGKVLATVNNEMIDAGLMPLMDEDEERRLHSMAAEIFAAVTVGAISAFIPLSVEDLAIDAATAGLGRIKKVGKAVDKVIDAIKAGGKNVIKKYNNVVEAAFERVGDIRASQIDRLLVDGKVPSVRGGEFNRWYDELTPKQLDMLWSDEAIRETMKARIRQPGGLHEWCMVCRAPTFKEWGVSVDEIKRFRTETDELTWIHPDTGLPGGDGSGQFHNELKVIIDNSRSLDGFNTSLSRLLERWSIAPELLPPLIGT
jgi:hypothetical protein